MRGATAETTRSLTPYLPRVAVDWAVEAPPDPWVTLDGTLVFADVSGFTRLSERLARRGRIGAEELTEAIGSCFARILAVAYRDGGSLVKFGGDALLLLFDGPGHEARACRAALRMRATMAEIGRLETSVGTVRLRISLGVHGGEVHVFAVGTSHRELVLTGPAATATVAMEAAAGPGEVVLSPATAAALPGAVLGAARDEGRLLRDLRVDLPEGPPFPGAPDDVDVAGFVPVALRQHLLAGGVEPEHRHVCIAFLRFGGVDAVVERSGPAAVAAALQELVGDVQAAAADEQVTFLASDIDRDGGKLILVSGAPRAREDDEGRLLRVVRRVADGRRALPVRIGVNRGHVFAGEIGPHYRRTYTVMGDAVNLAARLMAAAAPGQILATAGALERSRTTFDVAALEPFTVKGKREPVQAFAVGPAVGARAARDRSARLPFVGRVRELAVLEAALAGARARAGRLVEVVAEPGMGTSRLLDELRRRADDLLVLAVACEAYETITPYVAVRQLLADLLGLDEGVDVDLVAGRLRDRVAVNAPTLLPWLPLLAVPLNVDLAPTPQTASLEPRFRRERTAQVVVELLATLLPTPTLLVIEDAHNMDDASTDVFERLVAGLAGRPWAVCVTRRDRPTGFRAPPDGTVATIALGPLDSAEAAALVAAATGDAPLRPHEQAAVVERGGGTPLFLEELLRARGDDWQALPDSVEAVMAAEIDRLPPDDRRLLRYAAVLGRSFVVRELAAVAAGELDIGPGLTVLELEGFLEPGEGGRFQFRHQLVRDVAYEGLSFRRRRELHGRAGDAIARAAGRRAADHAELLSLHYLHAQRHERAWAFATLAADRARARYANVDAGELYERALAAARHLPSVPPPEVAARWEALGEVRERAGMYEQARAAYRAARRLLDRPVDHARLFLTEARLSGRQGRYSHSVRWTRRGLRLLDGLDDAEARAVRANLAVWYASVRQHQGRHGEAMTWCRVAVEEAGAAGERAAVAQAYRILDWAHMDLGQADQATHSAAALAIYEELGDLSGQGEVLNNLGGYAYLQGRWREALGLYGRSRAAKLRVGNEVDAAHATCNRAEILAAQGLLDEAEVGLQEALRVWRAAGFRAGVAFATMHLGRLAARRGDHDEAMRLLDRARAGFREIEATADVLEVDVWQAECLVLHGAGREALALAADALAREAAMGGSGVQRATLHRIRGYAFAQLGQPLEAWAALDESLAVARARHAPYELALTLEALSVVAGASGGVLDPPSTEEARLILDRLGVRWLPLVPVPLGGAMPTVSGRSGPPAS